MSSDSPFLLENEAAYQAWRSAKLTDYPQSLEALLVDIVDPASLSEGEYQAMMQRLRKANMVIYRSPLGNASQKAPLVAMAGCFGLGQLDSNLLADDDGLTSITVNPEGDHPRYIPYTSRPINWHCDGYYNTGKQQIRGMLLHCVQNAAEGGENQLLDHEMVYLQLRDENPEFIRALMAEDVMTIPPGKDGEGNLREASVGPVFSIQPNGSLHMRYTARKRNIEWKGDTATTVALAALDRVLEHSPYIIRASLMPGMGLLCNNVLHTRSAFKDDPAATPRLLYRARYVERIAAT